MGLFRRGNRKQQKAEKATAEEAQASAGSQAQAEDQPVELLVVLPGEQSGQSELTLQGSVQVGLLAQTLRQESLDGLYSCDTAGCLSTAEKIREGRAELETRAVPRASAEIAEWLAALRSRYAGCRVLLVADETVLRRILAGLEGVTPDETSIPPLSPASISRLTIRQDLSFSMRVNNTDHLDGITNSDRFRML